MPVGVIDETTFAETYLDVNSIERKFKKKSIHVALYACEGFF